MLKQIWKALKADLDRDKTLFAELHVAKELGMTLGQLQRNMTYAELWLWMAYLGLVNDKQNEQLKKASRNRR